MGKQQSRPDRARGRRAAVVARRDRRVNWGLLLAGLVVVGLVAAIAIVVFRAASDKPSGGTQQTLVPPANIVANGAIPVGEPSAPATVEIYLDFMCPACGQFEQANGEELDRLVRTGSARVELHLMSFLDRTSRGTRYSTRAASAVATVADRAPQHVWAFVKALYDNQPREGTSGLSDERITELAVEAGIGREVVDAFDERLFEPWVTSVTEAAFASGVQGTPTVKINGAVFRGDLYSPGPLTRAVEAAAGSGS